MHAAAPFAEFLDRLRAGDRGATAEVFDRFARRLVRLAHSQFDSHLRGRVDPEDVVQSVYRSFFTRCARGQYDLVSWDSLLGLLTVMTVHKCANRAKYWHRDRRDVGREV